MLNRNKKFFPITICALWVLTIIHLGAVISTAETHKRSPKVSPVTSKEIGEAANFRSFGATGEFFQIGALKPGTGIELPLKKEKTMLLQPDSIRLFRLDKSKQKWELVPESAYDPQKEVIYAKTSKPGFYTAVGASRYDAVYESQKTLAREGFVLPPCKLIQCPSDGSLDVAAKDLCDTCISGGIGHGNLYDFPELNLPAIKPSSPPAPLPPDGCFANVRDYPYNAKGDGITNDTEPFRAAIKALEGCTGPATLYVPPGYYLLKTVDEGQERDNKECGNVLYVPIRLGVDLVYDAGQNKNVDKKVEHDDLTILLSPDATLKAIPTRCSGYALLYLWNVRNVSVVGGTFIGDRTEHLATDGEWGMGIRVDGSSNVLIQNVALREFWGDGIYISGIPDNDLAQSNNVNFSSRPVLPSDHVAIFNVVSDHNRRCGITVNEASDIFIYSSTFKNTIGNQAGPEAGFCGEPDLQGGSLENVFILDSRFLNNYGAGGYFSGISVQNNAVVNSVFKYNGKSGFEIWGGYFLPNSKIATNNKIIHNQFEGNGWNHPLGDTDPRPTILLTNTADTLVKDNTIRRSRDWGISIENLSQNNTVKDNNFFNNESHAVCLKWYPKPSDPNYPNSVNNKISNNSCGGFGNTIAGYNNYLGNPNIIGNNNGCDLATQSAKSGESLKDDCNKSDALNPSP